MSKVIGLTKSHWGKNRTSLIYENGSTYDNGPTIEGEEIETISNTGENSIVISRDRWGNRFSSVIRLSDRNLIGFGRL